MKRTKNTEEFQYNTFKAYCFPGMEKMWIYPEKNKVCVCVCVYVCVCVCVCM